MDVADRIDEDLISSERDVLLHDLNKMRDAVVTASEGLTDDQQHVLAVEQDSLKTIAADRAARRLYEQA